MKKFLLSPLFFLLMCFYVLQLQAQSYDVLNYNLNGTPVNGIKIKTQIPFVDGGAMPTVKIEGYFYGESSPVGLDIVWYVYGNTFINAKVSSWGATTPPVYLSNENGFISIFINDKPYYPRFKITAFAKGMTGEIPSAFSGWTIADEPLGGTNQLLVTYTNRFAGTVTVGTNYRNLGDLFQVATGGGGQYFRVMTGGIGVADASWQNTLMISNNGSYNEIRNDAGKPLVFQYSTGGNVLIGKTSQTNTSYKLDINGNARANKIVVNTTGADYVFDSAFDLPKLDSLHAFIQKFHHLPGIPSANEMQKEGLDVGENQMKLLQKIEELTLIIIEQDKRFDAIEAKLQSQAGTIEQTKKKRH